MSSRSEAVLPHLLSAAGPLQATLAQDGDPIRNGRIYVAPPDYHLLLTSDTVRLGHGPREGLQRPSINVMFRSAAHVFGARTAGVVLTGMLDDGAAGLWEILQHGGATIVQDPEEAAYRSMPESAIRGLNVQYIVRLKEMTSLLARLSMGERREVEAQNDVWQAGDGVLEAPLTRQACPECGGVMRLEQPGDMKEYVCHVGHRLGLESMITDKTNVVERTMWKAVSQSEELIDLLEQSQGKAGPVSPESLQGEIASRRRDMETLRTVLERRKLSSPGK
jgi:two-component system chemotaxis response regulator CheB